MRTTQEVANRYMELARDGKFVDIQKELFDEDIKTIEPPGFPLPGTKGKKAVMERLQGWFQMVEQRHEAFISEPIVMGNYFSFGMMVDNTIKGMGRVKNEEICVYGVRDGKIILEQFFF